MRVNACRCKFSFRQAGLYRCGKKRWTQAVAVQRGPMPNMHRCLRSRREGAGTDVSTPKVGFTSRSIFILQSDLGTCELSKLLRKRGRTVSAQDAQKRDAMHP